MAYPSPYRHSSWLYWTFSFSGSAFSIFIHDLPQGQRHLRSEGSYSTWKHCGSDQVAGLVGEIVPPRRLKPLGDVPVTVKVQHGNDIWGCRAVDNRLWT